MQINPDEFNGDALDEMGAVSEGVMAAFPDNDDRVLWEQVQHIYSAGFVIVRRDVAAKGKAGRPRKYDWSGMEIGDGKRFPDAGTDMRETLEASARQWGTKNGRQRFSVTAMDGGGLVVARVA